ncbi:hypothetical protein A2U01_0082673, partial [Trifolium medium]|nr:hypothetical protein [Trifolium medium]
MKRHCRRRELDKDEETLSRREPDKDERYIVTGVNRTKMKQTLSQA